MRATPDLKSSMMPNDLAMDRNASFVLKQKQILIIKISDNIFIFDFWTNFHPKVEPIAGLPDFSQYVQHTKTEKIANNHKIYQTATKCTNLLH
jgi:hypothetical protein